MQNHAAHGPFAPLPLLYSVAPPQSMGFSGASLDPVWKDELNVDVSGLVPDHVGEKLRARYLQP